MQDSKSALLAVSAKEFSKGAGVLHGGAGVAQLRVT